MISKSKEYITEGPIWKSIITFMLPIMLGMFFQQLYNTVDAIVVGRYVGKEALAAVGGGTTFFINLLLGFCGGLSTGASIIISQFFGAKKFRDLCSAVHTFFILSFVMGIVVTLIGISLSEFAMNLINTPSDIYPNAVTYLKIYFLGITPMFMYNTAAGVLRATGDSKTPFYILVIGCFLNIFLDFLFVAVLNWGIAGVGYATLISIITGAVLIMIKMFTTPEVYRVELSELKANPSLLRKMFKLGVPSGLYSMMYTISNLIMMTFVNTFPTTTIAAWTAWGKLDALFWMSVSSMGMALNTFSGQNYGAKKYDRIKKGALQGLLIMYLITIALIILFRTCGRFIYGWFVPDEPQVIEMGIKIMLFLTPAFFLYVPNEILSGIIGGAGKTYISMIVTFFAICGTRMIWLYTSCRGTTDFIKVIHCYPISWLISATVFFIYYKSEKWIPKSNLAVDKTVSD
ncbi:MAG: MATE family efflux transporter [Treponema sp.]|uniref:MATE family efflux transporter n=1 Tax=Treponema sp. TaxID=166 RepID=UPI001B5F422A|nr:MATE family efflux transporter [Treponema sp.]